MIHRSPSPRRTGLAAGAFVIIAALAPLSGGQETLRPTKLEDSQVLITYGELRRLTEEAAQVRKEPPAPPGPPVEACLTQARFQLTFEKGEPRLNAAFLAENLSGGWASVPLGAFHAAAWSAVPPESRLARSGGQVRLLLEKPGRAELKLGLAPGPEGVFVIDPPAEAALSWMEWEAPPEGLAVQLTRADGAASRHERAGAASLAPDTGLMRLALVRRDESTPADRAQDSAIITEAVCQSQIAQDGAQLTSLSLRLEHGTAAVLPMELPAGAELLRCAVQGKPVAAGSGAGGGLTISLPAPTGEGDKAAATEVTLSYFLQGGALHAAEGELELTLPRSTLLIRRLEWTVELPEGLHLTAHGNVEPQAAAAPQSHVIQLSRRLCRDSVTQARITYRQPGTLPR